MFINEKFGQGKAIAQTLNSAIHVASVSEIGKTYDTFFSIWVDWIIHGFKVDIHLYLAHARMVLLIFHPALLVAILYFLAYAKHFHNSTLVTEFAFAMSPRVLVISKNKLS